MRAPDWAVEAWEASREQGFRGKLVRYRDIGDGRHGLCLLWCRFNDSESIYIAVADLHEGGGRPRMLPLSSAVHVLQNVSEDERWELELREAPP